ncbi:AMP-binding protein [Actinomadura sp. LD22]|uniref:AMP-binding protein n=1 Tax=Actinomadura physcomitrii TaxID=2650748 RepID=A0A6I4M4C1_9ACTN|nr:AMP-binding protein [Actinomadura physcomitrii]MWA00918.1 AMP-binding protein [Actinomadura physcomitrii]
MYPGTFAKTSPDRPAVVMGGSGEVVTYRDLDARSNRFAHLLRDQGLRPGDTLAVLSENRPEVFDLAWAAQRSGLQLTMVNHHLTVEESAYIVADSGARVVVATSALAETARGLSPDRAPGVERRLMIGDAAVPGWERYEDAVAGLPGTPIPDECEGDIMLYSSGTTGRPKGIRREVTGTPIGSYPDVPGHWLRETLGMRPGDVYLCPAPLYHAAPLAWSMACHRSGTTVVVMERFDAEQALRLIERHRVTHGQWVPTMFVRLLKLPEAVRRRYDLSSLRWAVHAAAPCPVPVKQKMIEWWGPLLYEFYSATEGIGATAITSEEWLRKPGSVGRPLMGTPHVLDDDGEELPPGEVGVVWFEGGTPFEYRGDPGKTAAATDRRGWRTVGDMGRLDEDGYLYLTDRATNMIISGGVNIYPQEVENALVLHPDVADAAVFGIPDEEMGEQVKAVVQLEVGSRADRDTAERLFEHCRAQLAGYKCPRSLEFTRDELRSPAGKVRIGPLRERFGSGPGPFVRGTGPAAKPSR